MARPPSGELLLDPGMARRTPAPGRGVLIGILALIALAAVIAPAWVVLHERARPYRDIVLLPRRVVPRDRLPAVEPVKLVALSPDQAREYNAAQPFDTASSPPARPFRFAGNADDRARALDCLAAAELYEAGDDTGGERAVAQVVLNRLRHPAFPKSICAVVFEGAERATGCQFTFTCDGALDRWRPSEAAWTRAREVASAALAGTVDRRVGYATHYHTDWVVPYWQASLDKIAVVGTHLFFRWTGWWGTPAAFDRSASPVEPVVAKLAALSTAHASAPDDNGIEHAVTPDAPMFGRSLKPLATDPDTFLTSLNPAQPPASYKAMALQACGERPHCKVLGWSDVSAMAFTLPLSPESQAALSFSYLRDRAGGFDKALWNCAEFKRAPAGACMKRAAVRAPAAPLPDPMVKADDAPRGPPALSGVRRRSVPTGKQPSPFPPASPAGPLPLPMGEGERRTAPEG